MKRVLEICANSAQSCVEAEMGGAARVELCAGIPEGGTTPSYGEIRMAQQLTEAIDINVLIRPRGGDFLYTENEVQSMLYDIEMCKDLNVHGVVFGCLQENGDLDIDLMERLKDAAGTLSVTCHRAFDVCRDPFKTMEELVRLGVDRILTSGQQNSAVKGAELLAELQRQAAGRIRIQAGGGICADAIRELYPKTGVTAYHMSGKIELASPMQYRKENVNMGLPSLSEYTLYRTDVKAVRSARAVLEEL